MEDKENKEQEPKEEVIKASKSFIVTMPLNVKEMEKADTSEMTEEEKLKAIEEDTIGEIE